MKIDQIAYYCASDKAEEDIKRNLGLTHAEWIEDHVTARVNLPQANKFDIHSEATLKFCYALGIELEILKYEVGLHWHLFNPVYSVRNPFISHVGAHLGDKEPFPEVDWLLVQECWTESHTSQYLTDPKSPGYGRKFHYRIYEIAPANYFKMIKRINP